VFATIIIIQYPKQATTIKTMTNGTMMMKLASTSAVRRGQALAMARTNSALITKKPLYLIPSSTTANSNGNGNCSSRSLATAAQKRALNKDQVGGGVENGAKPSPTQASPTAPPSGTNGSAASAAPPSGGGSRAGIFKFALGATALGGAGYGAFRLNMVPASVMETLGMTPGGAPPSAVKEEEGDATPEAVAEKDTAAVSSEDEVAVADVIAIGTCVDGVSVDHMHRLGFDKSITDPDKRPDICMRGPSHPAGGNRVRNIETEYAVAVEVEEIVDEPTIATLEQAPGKPVQEPAAGYAAPPALDETKPPPTLGQALRELSSKLTRGSTPSPPAASKPKPSITSTAETSRDPLVQKYLANLASLSQQELRERLVQLTSEINSLLQYEAIRLQHYQEEMQRQMSREHMEAMHQQKLILERVLAEKLGETHDALQKQMRRALDDKEGDIEQLLQSAKLALGQEHEAELQQELAAQSAEFQASFETALSAKLASIQAKSTQAMEAKVKQMESLQSRLEKMESVHQVSRSYEQSSRLAHQISAAALQLITKLESGTLSEAASVKRDVNALLALLEGSQSEPLLRAALEHLPVVTNKTAGGMSGRGPLPTVFELQTLFDTAIYPTARIAAQVPAGQTSLSAQLFGRVFAALTFSPAPTTSSEDGGLLATSDGDAENKMQKEEGDGAAESETSKSNNVVTSYFETSRELDQVLSLAKHYVNIGDMERAVKLLDHKLPPTSQVAFVVQDWKTQTKQRVAVDQVLHLLKMECAVMNERMKNA
jgi:hypothetical protein